MAASQDNNNSGFWVVGAIVAWVALALGVSYLRETLLALEGLDIIAAIRPVEATEGGPARYSVDGVVVARGEPASGARVWGVASDDQGNRIAITGEQTNATGHFQLGPFDGTIGTKPVTSVVLHGTWQSAPSLAAGKEPGQRGPQMSGREHLRLGAADGPLVRTRRLAPPFQVVLMFALAVAGFFLSIMVAAVPEKSIGLQQRPKYLIAMTFALVLMVTMSLAILNAMTYVATRGVTGDVFTFGFAAVFFGSHDATLPGEWMLSLTTPSTAGTRGAIGFYAPLWVMLMAVIGAGLLTLSLLVAEIKDPPVFDGRAADVRRRIQNIVMHQFFVVFAPLGAVFVYQMLVAAKAAEEPALVAIAALGAGATINALLKMAVDRGAQLFSAKRDDGERDAGNRGGAAAAEAEEEERAEEEKKAPEQAAPAPVTPVPDKPLNGVGAAKPHQG